MRLQEEAMAHPIVGRRGCVALDRLDPPGLGSPTLRPRRSGGGRATPSMAHSARDSDRTNRLRSSSPQSSPPPKVQLAYLLRVTCLTAAAASFRAVSTEAAPVTIFTTPLFIASSTPASVGTVGSAEMVLSIISYMPR